jgi:hypothetical protein
MDEGEYMYEPIFRAFQAGVNFHVNKFSQQFLQLYLFDESKTEDLCNKLNSKNTVTRDYKKNSFTAQIELMDANITDTNGVQRISKVPTVKIIYDSKDVDVMLEFIFAQLYKHGFGLDLLEQNKIRRDLSLGGEDSYIQRALPLIEKLASKADEPLTLEYTQLIKVSNEIPIDHKISFAYKIALLLKDKKLFKCALSFISLYQTTAICKTMLQQLQSRINHTTDTQLRLIVSSPVMLIDTHAGIIEMRRDDDEKIFSLAMADGPFRQNLLRVLSENCDLQIKEQDCKFSVSTSFIPTVPPLPALKLSISAQKAYLIFDYMLMILQKNQVIIALETRFTIRTQLGFAKLEHYYKCADAVIELMQVSKDDPTSFEFNWLLSMAFEIPIMLRSTFILKAAQMLQAIGYLQCALALAVGFKHDTICKELPALVGSIELKYYESQIMLMLNNVPENESMDAKYLRYENILREIAKLDCYSQFKSTADNLCYKLAGLNGVDIEGAEHKQIAAQINLHNLDATFRILERRRNDFRHALDVAIITHFKARVATESALVVAAAESKDVGVSTELTDTPTLRM